MKITSTIAAVLAAWALSAGLTAHAQDYPARPIRWVVPYLAGTAPDNTVRIVAEAMGGILKQAVIVDNKGGSPAIWVRKWWHGLRPTATPGSTRPAPWLPACACTKSRALMR